MRMMMVMMMLRSMALRKVILVLMRTNQSRMRSDLTPFEDEE